MVRVLGAAVLRGAVVRQCGGDARVARRERLYLQSGTGDDGSGRYQQDDPAPYERLQLGQTIEVSRGYGCAVRAMAVRAGTRKMIPRPTSDCSWGGCKVLREMRRGTMREMRRGRSRRVGTL